MPERCIVGLGGGSSTERETRLLIDYVVGLAESDEPRVCVVPTAVGDDAAVTLRLLDLMPERAQTSHVEFFPWPPEGLRSRVLAQDVIFVAGGSTANMLAVWRAHGFDAILREAWAQGIVLTGWSAGMICWYEAGVTDSFGPQLEGMRDGLGFLPGSACPHYDGEELRRPVYTKLVADGFPPGIAADDGVGARYEGTELAEIVSVRQGAQAYRVEPGGEESLPARLLT